MEVQTAELAASRLCCYPGKYRSEEGRTRVSGFVASYSVYAHGLLPVMTLCYFEDNLLSYRDTGASCAYGLECFSISVINFFMIVMEILAVGYDRYSKESLKPRCLCIRSTFMSFSLLLGMAVNRIISRHQYYYNREDIQGWERVLAFAANEALAKRMALTR